MNPEDSPYQIKRKQNQSYVPKEDSTKKLVVELDPNSEKGKRNTSTSLSQRINRKIHEKGMLNHLNDDTKNFRINRTE